LIFERTFWPVGPTLRFPRAKKISFYSERLGKKISGVYSISGRMLTVTSSDGRQKSAPLGGSNPETLARLTLIELEATKSE
jgi:hypothetical protein